MICCMFSIFLTFLESLWLHCGLLEVTVGSVVSGNTWTREDVIISFHLLIKMKKKKRTVTGQRGF